MNIPQALILFRFLSAPCILYMAVGWGETASPYILLAMYLGLISDILDGIIARKFQQSTTSLRRLDSQTDMVFWLSIGIASWHLHPEILAPHSWAIALILSMELSVYVVSFLKFGKETCTHAFLSKLWGLSLLAAFTSLIGFGQAGIPFYVALWLGILSHADRICITLLLPQWTHDIPSAYHAYLLRKGHRFSKNKYLNS
ncbi:MAG: hypothetical protein RIS47_951 [Bacteroidota bacterium]|jgi:CDP-diacylglycerol--glycerol-3-phosphate 3-phosphatidyltransferase